MLQCLARVRTFDVLRSWEVLSARFVLGPVAARGVPFRDVLWKGGELVGRRRLRCQLLRLDPKNDERRDGRRSAGHQQLRQRRDPLVAGRQGHEAGHVLVVGRKFDRRRRRVRRRAGPPRRSPASQDPQRHAALRLPARRGVRVGREGGRGGIDLDAQLRDHVVVRFVASAAGFFRSCVLVFFAGEVPRFVTFASPDLAVVIILLLRCLASTVRHRKEMVTNEHGGRQCFVTVGSHGQDDAILAVPFFAATLIFRNASPRGLGEGSAGGMSRSRPHNDGKRHRFTVCGVLYLESSPVSRGQASRGQQFHWKTRTGSGVWCCMQHAPMVLARFFQLFGEN